MSSSFVVFLFFDVLNVFSDGGVIFWELSDLSDVVPVSDPGLYRKIMKSLNWIQDRQHSSHTTSNGLQVY